MSTSPDDRIVALLSRWLARHAGNAEVQAEIEAAGREGLSAGQAEALDELLDELARAGPKDRAALEPLVRETIEALAVG